MPLRLSQNRAQTRNNLIRTTCEKQENPKHDAPVSSATAGDDVAKINRAAFTSPLKRAAMRVRSPMNLDWEAEWSGEATIGGTKHVSETRIFTFFS